MKKLLLILTVMLLTTVVALAQNPSPGIFNYQGVARNSVGNVLVNKLITLRLTIRDGAAAGPLLYQESRNVTTNPFGLFNVQVGSAGGSNVTGTVAGINLGAPTSNKFIQVEIDPNGGTTFINIGTAQIASVPYSLYSSLSNDLVLPFLKTQADAGTLFRINNSGTGISGAIMGVTQSNANNAWGVHGRVDNTSAGGFSSGILGTNLSTTGLGIGVTGSQNGSGWGVYGTTPSGIGGNFTSTSGTGVSGSSGSGNGVNGSSTSGIGGNFSSTTGRALQTAGGVRLTGINEAANRILATVPGNGDATWQSPAAVGIVTGSGTLNFVPKWTPNGTNLGNSEIFDNGTLVGLGTTTPFNTQLHIATDGVGANGFAGVRYTNPTSAAGTGGLYMGLNFATGSQEVYVGTNETADMGFYTSGANRLNMTAAGNIGIGNVTPAARLQVDNANANATTVINQSSVANGNNALNVLSTNTANNAYGNATSWVQRGIGSLANTFLFLGPTASKGVAATPGGFGIQGTSETGVGVTGLSTTSIGVFGASTGSATAVRAEVFFGNPAAYALQTVGRVQISGQNAGLNRVLTSDAAGNATWQTLGAGVGIGGGGTLNFVSKWTPDGSNLGNSQITDNASTVSVGFPFFANNSITVQQTPSAPVNPSIAMISASRAAGSYLENSTGNVYFTLNANTVASGTKVMTLGLADLNVGINTAAPVANAKLHVNGYGTGADQTSVYADGDLGFSDGHGVIGDGEWRGVWGRNTGAGSRIEATAVRGDAAGSNYSNGFGVRGTSLGSGTLNWGVYGEASGASSQNYGVWGQAPVTPNDWAGVFFGRVFIADGTQGANKVFTSDAGGNGSWQSAAALNLVSGNGTLNFVPKWTPNGTTLGNSLIFDNGSSVNVGTTTPTFAGLNTLQNFGQTRAAGTNPGFWADKTAAGDRNIFVFRTGGGDRWSWGTEFDDNLRLHNWTTGNAEVIYGDISNDRIGFSTNAPAAKVHIENSATQVGFRVNNSNVTAANRSIEVQIAGINSFNDAMEISVQAAAPNNAQFVEFDRGGTNQFAVNTDGSVDFNGALRPSFGTGGAAGEVLTSNGPTVAPSWQGPASLKVAGIGVPLVIPTNTQTPITQWASVIHELGSVGNYNAITGEYTVPANGVYHVSAHILWNQPTVTGSGWAAIDIFINGVFINAGYNGINAAQQFTGSQVSADLNLNAGDRVSIVVFQATGANLGISSFPGTENHFSVHKAK